MTTAPNLEAFQDFSKQQIEAFTAASTTFTKGLQEIAAEIDRLFEEGFRRRIGRPREVARRPQR